MDNIPRPFRRPRSLPSLITDVSAADNLAQDLPLNNDLTKSKGRRPGSNDAPHSSAKEEYDRGTTAGSQDKPATEALPIIEGIINDRESLSVISDKLRTMHYGPLGKRLWKTEKEKLMIRARQAMFHVELTEIRMTNMEKEIKQLRKDVDNLPEDFLKPIPEQRAYLREIKRVDSTTFQFTPEKAAMPDETKPVIEVLLASQNVISLPKEITKEIPVLSGAFVERQDKQGPVGEVTGPVVERIRVRSRPLLLSLENATHSRILVPSDGDSLWDMVFLRPFKLFVTFEKEIRSAFDALKVNTVKLDDNLDAKDLAQDKEEAARQALIQKLLLKDMELLIEVLDIDLKSLFNLREEIRNGTLEKIAYSDLWHLFEYGDDIVASSNMSQVYRVVGFTVSRL